MLQAVGLLLTLMVAWIMSANRWRINYWRLIPMFIFQVATAMFMLRTTIGVAAGAKIGGFFELLYTYADSGAEMVFGQLAYPGAGAWGFIFAVKVTALITFVGGLMSLLSYWGVISFLVRGAALIVTPLFGVSGAEGLCAVANSILGQIEAPMLVKDYVPDMTRSEIFTVMVSGMATISIVLVIAFGNNGIPTSHLLTSSIMSVPGSLLIAKIMVPEESKPKTMSERINVSRGGGDNVIDAISSGASNGFAVSGIILAMLLMFVSLIAMLNASTESLAALFGFKGWSLDFLMGKFFSPVTKLLGIVTEEADGAASLIGKRVILNEFVAYFKVIELNFSARTLALMTYALCGFANVSSIGMQVGGISVFAPNQRSVMVKLGVRALVGATLVNILNAFIVSLLI